jgi:hypothetical protein
MKSFNCILPGLVLAVGLGLFSMPQPSLANPDFTKRTGKQCTYCHVGSWDSGKYTEAGQYFKEHRSFKGYVPKAPPKSTSLFWRRASSRIG